MKLLHLLIAIAVMLGVATLWLRNSLVRSEGLRDHVTKKIILDEQYTNFVDGRIDAKIDDKGGIEEKIMDLRNAIRDIQDETKQLRVDLEDDRKDDFQDASETPVTPV